MKYARYIETAGGWDRFQGLLSTLSDIAGKYDRSISNVASAWALSHSAIGATIIGARLGENEHRQDNLNALSLAFDEEDRAALSSATGSLDPVPGDCGDEYRKPPFLTASGDLSHHLDALPPVFPTAKIRSGRHRADSGSIWEAKAGFARALRDGNRILVSGTTATTPSGDPVCEGDAEGQAVYILDKITAAIEALGGTLSDVARTRVYLREANDWQSVSKVHARYFGDVRPANTLIGGLDLIGPYDVEIEAEAILTSDSLVQTNR
jgi:enamine deaminase RidA (YjgF/YER057c/UK114 family)